MIKELLFGRTRNGEEVKQFVLENGNGMRICLLTYGAVLSEVWVPDKHGRLDDVVLGFDALEDYEVNEPHLGAVIGRVANRIANAEFTLNGKRYALDANDGPNCLHGGHDGYDKRVWQAAADEEKNEVTFSLDSPDGDQGFPGNMTVSVSYQLTEKNEIVIRYTAGADQDTLINLTNHSYFNLSGDQGAKTVLDQTVWLNADYYTKLLDTSTVPSGEISLVEGTPMDFTEPKKIGQDIESPFDQLRFGSGYDHNWVLNVMNRRLTVAGVLYDEETGRRMIVYTDLPGMQMYTGNFLREDMIGKGGVPLKPRSGICFETQIFPDAVHHENFPSCVFKEGEIFNSTTIYRFDAVETIAG